ncbi:helix-turn-helix domain-containing protein [Nocardiopsis alba]|uniref:helix-turn-helix domain-containing protein n=1 Tax=Nocardiopsis alba TaxID=53437 RepID=UPI003D716C29
MTENLDQSDVRFGQSMTMWRKRSGKTQQALARHLGCTKGHVSQIENGRRTLSRSKVKDVDNFLETGGRLEHLYSELYHPEQVDWVSQFHQVQAEAEVIRDYHNSAVPGWLQTEGYAMSLISSGAPWVKQEEVQKRAALRVKRAQQILREDGPQCHVVMDDVAVLRPIGPPKVMREQIEHLLKLAKSGRVLLQMQGWGQIPHAGLDGPMTLIASPSAPELVHFESVYRGQSTDVPKVVRQFGTLFSRLQATARSPQESVVFLKEMSSKYE